MKFGICGYGNLGRAVEKTLAENKEQLVGIFTRRKNVKSDLNTPVYDLEQAHNFREQIDVMFMCGGSQEDLLWQSPKILKDFNIIDSFDTHARLQEHKENLDKIAKDNNHVAVYSCGWDPGLFSLIRGLCVDIFGASPQTFWGKGVSQGHSEALRNIKGVADGIQFTVPDADVMKKVKSDPTFVPDKNQMHKRLCYICLDGTRKQEDIIEEIKNTENYFKGQDVHVKVCSQKEIDMLKQKTSHKGNIFCGDKNSKAIFSVYMDNNPQFTAKIMYAYSKSIKKLKSGAYNVLEIPVKFLEKTDEQSKII